MLNRLLSFKNHLRFIVAPIIQYKMDRLGDLMCVNSLKREVPIVISTLLFGSLEKFVTVVDIIFELGTKMSFPSPPRKR